MLQNKIDLTLQKKNYNSQLISFLHDKPNLKRQVQWDSFKTE